MRRSDPPVDATLHLALRRSRGSGEQRLAIAREEGLLPREMGPRTGAAHFFPANCLAGLHFFPAERSGDVEVLGIALLAMAYKARTDEPELYLSELGALRLWCELGKESVKSSARRVLGTADRIGVVAIDAVRGGEHLYRCKANTKLYDAADVLGQWLWQGRLQPLPFTEAAASMLETSTSGGACRPPPSAPPSHHAVLDHDPAGSQAASMKRERVRALPPDQASGMVLFREGNIFQHENADLTVLPCSAKGTVSSAARSWIKLFGIAEPTPKRLGEIEVIPFPGPGRVTKYIAWAASVLNDASSPEAIKNIGELLGEHATQHHDEIAILESPLLGSGAGKRGSIEAGLALREGFMATCRANAVLTIYMYENRTVVELRRAVNALRTPRR